MGGRGRVEGIAPAHDPSRPHWCGDRHTHTRAHAEPTSADAQHIQTQNTWHHISHSKPCYSGLGCSFSFCCRCSVCRCPTSCAAHTVCPQDGGLCTLGLLVSAGTLELSERLMQTRYIHEKPCGCEIMEEGRGRLERITL